MHGMQAAGCCTQIVGSGRRDWVTVGVWTFELTNRLRTRCLGVTRCIMCGGLWGAGAAAVGLWCITQLVKWMHGLSENKRHRLLIPFHACAWACSGGCCMW